MYCVTELLERYKKSALKYHQMVLYPIKTHSLWKIKTTNHSAIPTTIWKFKKKKFDRNKYKWIQLKMEKRRIVLKKTGSFNIIVIEHCLFYRNI